MLVAKNILIPKKQNSVDPKSKGIHLHLRETKREDQVGIN